MPATPGTSTTVTVNPAIGLTKSDTKDPFFGLEAGRTFVGSTVRGGGGEEYIVKASKK
jgi:hypothetical protein